MAKPLYPRALSWLGWCLAAALALWLAFAPLDEVVRGGGRIVPQARTQTIQHLEGGIIQDILVHEGQLVRKGDPLFRLHDQNARTARNEQAIGLDAMLLRKLRLEAELANAPTLVFPPQDQARNPEMAAGEQQLFAARQNDFSQQIQVLAEQKRQKTLQMMDIQQQVKNLEGEQQTAQRQLDINQKLHANGALSESRLLETQAQMQSLTTRFLQARAQLPILQAELNEVGKREQQLRGERHSKVADDLAELNVQMRQHTEREKSLGDTLDRTVVVAPVNGIINRLLVSTVGGVVQPGATLAELTPTDGNLVVEGKIVARDRARLWNGQGVTVRVSAYDYTSFGSFTGTIRDIGADSLREDNGGLYYRVMIDISSTKVFSAVQHARLIPGMTVDFYVKGARQSALQQLFRPLREMFAY